MKKYLIFVLILIILVGCNETNETSEFIEIEKEELSTIAPSPGGTITIPITNYEKINPLIPSNSYVYYFTKLIFDNLFEYNEDGGLEENLVEHYIISPDKLSMTLTIKDNIYWHDGTKLTTNDIYETFNYLKSLNDISPYFKNFRNSVGMGNDFDSNNFLEMEIFDDRNIDLHFDNTYGDKLEMLTFPILKVSEIENLRDDSSLNTFVGTGAYKLDEIIDGSQINLSRNENYHKSQPYIENVEAKIFNDEELAMLAFETGLIDIVRSTNYDWAKYQDDNSVKIEEYMSNEMDLIIFNNTNQLFRGENGKKLKQAISRSINKKRIIDRLFLGKAIETSVPLNKNKMDLYGLRTDNYYNEEISKNLLSEIGYSSINEEGLLSNDEGNSINIQVTTNYSNYQKRIICEFIIEDLRAIGINAYSDYNISSNDQLSTEEIVQLNEEFREDLENSSFQLAIVSVNLTDISDMSTLLHTNSIGDGLNYGNYSNYNLDNHLNNIKLSDDMNYKKEEYLKAIEIYSEDMPIVPLYTKTNAILIDNNIQNQINPINSDVYRSFNNLFILKQFQ